MRRGCCLNWMKRACVDRFAGRRDPLCVARHAGGRRTRTNRCSPPPAAAIMTLIRDSAGDTWVAPNPRLRSAFWRHGGSGHASAVDFWLDAFLRFALVAAAPLAAMAVLYLLMRQNAQPHAWRGRSRTRRNAFQIAADGAKVGVLEWRPAGDEVVTFRADALRVARRRCATFWLA